MKTPILLRIMLVCLTLSLTSCENGNLFGGLHKSGGSGDVKSLSSDAAIAFRDKNYSTALDLYQRILAKEPNNSEALYGAAAAALGTSGLNPGQILTNLAHQTNSGSSVNGLGDVIAQSREHFSASSGGGAGSVLAGINLDALNSVIDLSICRLQRIRAGASNGVIKQDDIDVTLNLGILFFLRAALRAIRADYIDVVNTNGDYTITHGANYGTLCATDSSTVQNIGIDVVSGYVLFVRAVNLLNLGSDKTISKIAADAKVIADKLLDPASPDHLDTTCLNALNAAGISLTTYATYSGPFTAPSGC